MGHILDIASSIIFWAVGYFAESVGHVTENVIIEYIKNQNDKPSMSQQKSLGL